MRLFEVMKCLLLVSILIIGVYTMFVVQYEKRSLRDIVSGNEAIFESFQLDNMSRVYLVGMKIDTEWSKTSDRILKRALTKDEHRQMVELLEVFDNLMKRNNITYIMCDGTLLGSYFFHDFIPWDDDLDLMMAWSDRPKLSKIFLDKEFRETYEVRSFQDKIDWYSVETLEGRNPKLRLKANRTLLEKSSQFKFKFYKKSSKKAGKYEWRWPFIDIKFYNETNDVIRNIDFRKRIFNVSRSDFFPLHQRPFAHLWLPAPHNTRLYLQTKYKQFVCRSHPWDHKNEKGKGRASVACNKLYSVYPHVHRTQLEHDGRMCVMESLLLGSKLLHNVLVDEPWHKESNTYDLS